MATSNGSMQAVNNSTDPAWIACFLWPDKTHYCDVIMILRKTTASLSLVGVSFMIFVIWLLKKYQLFSQRVVLYLSIAAFMDCTAFIMSNDRPNGHLCNFEAFWATYWDWSVLLWVGAITFCMLLVVLPNQRADKFKWVIHAICWFVPLFFASLPLFADHYGPSGAWCWIKNTDKGWRFGIWYVPLFVMIAVMFIIYPYIIIRFRKQARAFSGNDADADRHRTLLRKDMQPLRLYPFIYLTFSLFPLINRIQNAVSPGNPVFALFVLHSLTSPLKGFLYAVAFGLDRETRQYITPTQIKIALENRFHSGPSKVPEPQPYPAVPDTDEDISYTRF